MSKAICRDSGCVGHRDGSTEHPRRVSIAHIKVKANTGCLRTARGHPSYNGQSAFTLIELMIVLAILAILMALALPAYNTYVARSKVSECLHAAAAMKLSISEVAMTLPVGTFPADEVEAAINPGSMAGLEYCDAALYASTGVLTLQVDEAAVGVSGTIEMALVPAFAGTSQISWDCQPAGTTNTAIQYLPTGCRM